MNFVEYATWARKIILKIIYILLYIPGTKCKQRYYSY